MPPIGSEPFLKAVLDNPDDDNPRLVYADWLDEQGDPYGEFIRWQLGKCDLPRARVRKLARSPFREKPFRGGKIVRWNQLSRRVVTERYHPRQMWLTFRAEATRGFPERVTLPPDSFVELAADIFRAAPVREVILWNRQCPYPFQNGWTWWYGGEFMSANLPRELMSLFSEDDSGRWMDSPVAGRFCRWWRTSGEAIIALNRACVAYGRKVAKESETTIV